jgi:AAA+ ATPase superfamily predicted ATPase
MLARQLIAALPSEGVSAEDIAVSWNALLRYASQQTKERKKAARRFALILDEFPYLVDQTPELPSILQAWWDREAVHSPLFIVLCGSQLSAMAALGQESAPLFGRFSAGIFHLDPLHYEDAAAFYADSPITVLSRSYSCTASLAGRHAITLWSILHTLQPRRLSRC